jgi:hypothetical protein
MSIERKQATALPTRSRSWENLVPHIDLGQGVRARHIQLDMERAPTFDLYAKAGNVLEVMQANRWDNVPVTSKGRVVGYARRTQLARAEADQPIRKVTHSLAGGAIVSGDTPIADLMGWIARQRIVFVLEGREVTGIVTIWDFNKQTARAYYYLVLAGLEIALADLIRWRYGKNQSNLIAHLGSRDTQELNERMERDRSGSGHGDLVSYLDFKHLLRVFERDRSLRAELGTYDRAKWNSMTKPLGELRNEVMHPVKTLVGSVEDMEALARDINHAIELVEQAIVALRKKYPVKPS